MSARTKSPQPFTDIIRDIFLWKKKKLSVSVIFIATVLWVLLEVYQFNFITVMSWLAMSIVAFLFLWGNFSRLLGREPPRMSRLEIPEESAISMAKSLREGVEEGIRWMFRVGVESEWHVFAGTVAGLWILSWVGSLFDLHALLYIGIVLGMTVPVIYERYEEKIKGWMEQMKVQCRRSYNKIDEKVFRNVKKKILHEDKHDKVVVHEDKEEKVE